MARRELLTEEERTSLFGVPTARAALARHYTLGPDDLDFLGARRSEANRLGAATWLSLLRHPGFGLRHDATPPRELVAYLADQLGVSEQLFAAYAVRAKTRLEHGWEIAAHLGLRGFEASDLAFALDEATQAAWSTDHGLPIARAVVEGLRSRHVILPAPARIERIGLAGRARARKRAMDALSGALTADQASALDALLVPDPTTGVTPIAWLRDIADSPSARNLSGLLSRLAHVRRIGLDHVIADTVHERRFRKLVREGAVAPAFLLSDYSGRRRRATLAAQVIDLEARLSDAAVQMFDKQVGELFASARAAQKRHNVSSARDVGPSHAPVRCHPGCSLGREGRRCRRSGGCRPGGRVGAPSGGPAAGRSARRFGRSGPARRRGGEVHDLAPLRADLPGDVPVQGRGRARRRTCGREGPAGAEPLGPA